MQGLDFFDKKCISFAQRVKTFMTADNWFLTELNKRGLSKAVIIK